MRGFCQTAYGGGRRHIRRDLFFHIVGEKAAVRPGIGAKLLFIESLQIVQRLLGRIAQRAVGVPLEAGQVVERWGLFASLPALDACHRRPVFTVRRDSVRRASVFQALRGGRKAAVQLDRVEGLRQESRNLRFPPDQHGQRRGHDPSDVQGPTITQGEITGGVDPHQPVRLCPAEGGLVQAVIVPAGAQILKALPDRPVLHAGDPKALHGFRTARQLVDGAEDQFPLPSGVAGVDHLRNVRGAQQLPQYGKLLLLVRNNGKLKGVREDGQVLQPPFGEIGMIGRGVGKPRQVAETPGDDRAAPGQVALVPFGRPDDGGDAPRHAGLFRDDKLVQ